VLGHRGIGGNEIANQLARLGAEDPFTGPEQACRALAGVPEKAVRDWIIRNHKKYWESLRGLKHAKGFQQRTSAIKTGEQLKLNKNLLWWVTGILTGHCQLKGHPFKLGLTNNPTCEMCLEKINQPPIPI
jgi:hypothetical protein